MQPRSLAIAATLVLAVLAVTIFTVFRGSSWIQPEQPSVRELMTLGEGVLESDETVVIEKTRVDPGATLAIYSKDTVVFGDGFSVARGASLVVGTSNADSESKNGFQ